MKRPTALFVICLTVAGCQTYWTKPGFNIQEWNRDKYECERDMRQSGYYGTGFVGALNAQSFFEECLVARGYYKTQQVSSAPPAPASSLNVSHTSIQEAGGSSADTAAGDDATQLDRDLKWIQHLKDVGAISDEEYEQDRLKTLKEHPGGKP